MKVPKQRASRTPERDKMNKFITSLRPRQEVRRTERRSRTKTHVVLGVQRQEASEYMLMSTSAFSPQACEILWGPQKLIDEDTEPRAGRRGLVSTDSKTSVAQ